MAVSLPWFFAVDHLKTQSGALNLAGGANAFSTVPDSGVIADPTLGRNVICQGNSVYAVVTLPSSTSICVGMRNRPEGATGTYYLMTLRQTGASTSIITVGSTGVDGFYRVTVNGVNYDSTTVIQLAWSYIELFAYIHATAGVIELRVNGQTIVMQENINTKGSGADTFGSLRIMGTTGTSAQFGYFTDIYAREAATRETAFYGPIEMIILRPSADVQANWTPNGGANNYSRVMDSTGHDGDTTYIETAVADTEDIYTMPDVSAGVTSIIAVVPVAVGKAPSGGSPTITLGLTSGGSTTYGAAQTLTSGYQSQVGAAQTEKPGGGGWTAADVNAMQMRIKA